MLLSLFFDSFEICFPLLALHCETVHMFAVLKFDTV